MTEDFDQIRREKKSKINIVSLVIGCVLIAVVLVTIYIVLFYKKDTVEVKPEVKEVIATPVEPVVEAVEEPAIIEETVIEEKEVVAKDLKTAIDELDDSIIQYSDYTLVKDEDLNSVAKKFELDVQTLLSINKIKNIAKVVEGYTLKIPNRDGFLYTVKSGDMLSTLSSKFSLDIGWQGLKDLNNLDSETIFLGQELFIPTVSENTNDASQLIHLAFTSPLKGVITGYYSDLLEGEKLSGVVISSTSGSLISSAEKGSVIEVNKNDKLGKYIVIEHIDGYKTTYSHLETIFVKKGDEVEKASDLGTIGKSDTKYKSPSLYFMIEQNNIKLDPLSFF